MTLDLKGALLFLPTLLPSLMLDAIAPLDDRFFDDLGPVRRKIHLRSDPIDPFNQ